MVQHTCGQFIPWLLRLCFARGAFVKGAGALQKPFARGALVNPFAGGALAKAPWDFTKAICYRGFYKSP